MDSLINNLIQKALGNIMAKSRDAILLEDETYIQDSIDKETLEERFDALQIDKKDRAVIDDYIACIGSMDSRVADISYIAGVSDAVKLLNSLGLLKKYE